MFFFVSSYNPCNCSASADEGDEKVEHPEDMTSTSRIPPTVWMGKIPWACLSLFASVVHRRCNAMVSVLLPSTGRQDSARCVRDSQSQKNGSSVHALGINVCPMNDPFRYDLKDCTVLMVLTDVIPKNQLGYSP